MSKKLNSISDIHKSYGLAPPVNPLISIIDMKDYVVKEEWIGMKFINGFYIISMKDGGCGLEYGRNTYDFEEGVMSFMAPDQVFSVSEKPKRAIKGWVLYIHPDLIRNTDLGMKIDNYNFFSYDVHEALHLSEQEQKTITDCINIIDQEIKERIDKHNRNVVTSGLTFLLNFCNRFYERQFNTRAVENKDVLAKVEQCLKHYYSSDNIKRSGLPNVKYLAERVNLSSGYLSDLLKADTGKTAKDHINLFLVNKAKAMLLNGNNSVSEVAYNLGFEYPQHFSKMFKIKTGMSPSEYRMLS